MPRLLSGLQPSGQLHLGNYCGAIQPLLALQDAAAGPERRLFVFVASYHALTSVADPAALRANCRQVVVDYLAFGLDPWRDLVERERARVLDQALESGCRPATIPYTLSRGVPMSQGPRSDVCLARYRSTGPVLVDMSVISLPHFPDQA